MVFDALNRTFSKLTSMGKGMKKTVEDSLAHPVDNIQKMQSAIVRNLPLLPKSTLFEDLVDRIKREEFASLLTAAYTAFQKNIKKETLPAEDFSVWKSLGKELDAAIMQQKSYMGRVKLSHTVSDDVQDLVKHNKFPESLKDGHIVQHKTRGLTPAEKEIYEKHLTVLRASLEKAEQDVQKYTMASAYGTVAVNYDVHQEVKTLKEAVAHTMDALVNQLVKSIGEQRAVEKILYTVKREFAAYKTAQNKWETQHAKEIGAHCEDLLRKELPVHRTAIEANKQEEGKLHASFAAVYEWFQTHFTTMRNVLLKWYESRLQQNRDAIEAARRQWADAKKKEISVASALDGHIVKLQALVKSKDKTSYKKMKDIFEVQMTTYGELTEAEYVYLTWFYRTRYGYEAAASYAHTMLGQRNTFVTERMIQLKGIQMYTKLYLRFKQRYISVVKDILNTLLDVRGAEWKEVKELEVWYQKELDEVTAFVAAKEKEILKNDAKIDDMKKEFGEIDGVETLISYQHDLLQRMYWGEMIGLHAEYLQHAQKAITASEPLYTDVIAFIREMLQSKRVIADDKRASLAIHKSTEISKDLQALENEIDEYQAFLERLEHQQHIDADTKDDIVVVLKEYDEKQKKYTKEQKDLEANITKQEEKVVKHTLLVLPHLIQGKKNLLPTHE